jgi:hypothetical protein
MNTMHRCCQQVNIFILPLPHHSVQQNVRALLYHTTGTYVEEGHASLRGEAQALDADAEELRDQRLELLRRARLLAPSHEELPEHLDLE